MLVNDHVLNNVKRFKAMGFSDTAVLWTHDADPDGEFLPYGHEKHTFTERDSFSCRFIPISGSPRPAEDVLDAAHVPMIDGDLYFGHGVPMNPYDRVQITHVHGELQTVKLMYEIVAGPIIESTGQRATLKLMTEETPSG